MRLVHNGALIEAIVGDITKLDVDVVVNAANSSLLAGGKLNDSIHAAAGQGLLDECWSLEGCEIGDAKITQGYALPAGHVIHAVGPIWLGGAYHEADDLARCYRRAMQLAAERFLGRIAFPCISTGGNGYPKARAAEIAVREVQNFLLTPSSIRQVIFCCASTQDYDLYADLLCRQYPEI